MKKFAVVAVLAFMFTVTMSFAQATGAQPSTCPTATPACCQATPCCPANNCGQRVTVKVVGTDKLAAAAADNEKATSELRDAANALRDAKNQPTPAPNPSDEALRNALIQNLSRPPVQAPPDNSMQENLNGKLAHDDAVKEQDELKGVKLGTEITALATSVDAGANVIGLIHHWDDGHNANGNAEPGVTFNVAGGNVSNSGNSNATGGSATGGTASSTATSSSKSDSNATDTTNVKVSNNDNDRIAKHKPIKCKK